MRTAKEMLKASDVAPLLGVTTGRVYQLISEGVLPGTRVGRAVCIPRTAWERWLREQSSRAERSARTARRLASRPRRLAASHASV